jgi:hypothetical protein
MELTADQLTRAVEVMREYLNAPRSVDGKTPPESSVELDAERAHLIDGELKPLVKAYLAAAVPLSEFKSKIDGINKQHEKWGFKGIKGQMFFNMVVNVANDEAECDQEIKAAIAAPANEDMARSRIRTFASYVRRLGETHVEAGGTKQGRPNVGSVPFFLSYFWQIQDRHTWPVYYTNSVNKMIDLNLWRVAGDLAEDYVSFKHLHEELANAFSKESSRPFDNYGVEHVFWFKGTNPYGAAKVPPVGPNLGTPPPVIPIFKNSVSISARLPESYVPPIIAVLPEIARNDAGFDALAKASGTSLERAFEKGIHAAFTILGYETKLLGQGKGRVPDGLALDHDNQYGILWDGKIRDSGYVMGTDDRTIREYINTQSRDLRRRSLRNIYYVVVSSGFADDFDDEIRSIKMETDISEVCLLEAAALVRMVDARLRAPLEVRLGADGLQRLFSTSRIITEEIVMQDLSLT